MVEVDRLAVEEFHIELLQMMENAGRSLARLALGLLPADRPAAASVAVLAGPGGNGGGAMACARRLHAWGVEPHIILTRAEADHAGATAHQLAALRLVGVQLKQADQAESLSPPELIIDGLVGYGITGEPRGAVAQLIQWANGVTTPILALDLPSGLDATLGPVHRLCIRADATLTLAAPKQGLLLEEAVDLVGSVYLADIGVPAEVYAAMGIDGKWGERFAEGDILRVVP
jgi:NAD(P)H-hydrate epimerase